MVLRFFSLALLFLFASCSVPERDSPYDPKGINYQGSGPPSNDGSNCSLNGSPVTIGSQVWMSENLNCDVSGSKCYNDQETYCTTYGRLYDWATAMALSPDCNTSSCASQITKKHRGICPDGWHIPSDEDWETLVYYVGSSTGGTKLKSISWTSGDWPGTDMYDFAALPGGLGNSDGKFFSIGSYGNWWKFYEQDNTNNAYIRRMRYNGEDIYRNYNSKSYYIPFSEQHILYLRSIPLQKR